MHSLYGVHASFLQTWQHDCSGHIFYLSSRSYKQATESGAWELYPLNVTVDEMPTDKNCRTNNSIEHCGPRFLKAKNIVPVPCFVLTQIFDSRTKSPFLLDLVHRLNKKKTRRFGSPFCFRPRSWSVLRRVSKQDECFSGTQWMRIARSKGSTRLCAPLPEDRSRSGFQNVVF
jgi:hypothetical protein